MRYIAYVGESPIACLGWAAAAWKVAVRDHFIGWTIDQRRRNLSLVINNTRFLVLAHPKHLASHLLAKNIRSLISDWQRVYGYAPALLETFVDTTRFAGTCYKAANWISIGFTQGRGRDDRTHLSGQSVKAVLLYPLRPDFREVLCRG